MSESEYFLTYFEINKFIAMLQVIPSFLGQDLQKDIICRVIALEFPVVSPLRILEEGENDEYVDYKELNVIYLDEQGIPYIF